MPDAAEQIRREIREKGPISFARFMSMALYQMGAGYYERPLTRIGRRGDFITSVSVGPFFGELLAFQFSRWLEELCERTTSRLQLVEAGAHDGQLAMDILATMEDHEPVLFSALEYGIVEPSAGRRAVQQQALARFNNVRWFDDLTAFKGNVDGIIFSNELLDAMPVHRFTWNVQRGTWEEMGVALRGDSFAWTRLAQSTLDPPQFPEALLEVLPNGYVFECSPEATRWWRLAASALRSGRLMTIDYGGTFEELLSPSRTGGTLRAYSRQHATQDVLSAPGEQDITAHVNFTTIRRAGEEAGLMTETFTAQSGFLTAVARDLWSRRGSWPNEQVRQFQTLTHPEHFGRPYRVLIQTRRPPAPMSL